MRKKYLSALLFGALLVTSAGTFTSCKDYDDEINNLQTQIDKVAADLADLAEQIKNSGNGVSSVTFNEETGVLTVVTDGQTTTYTVKTGATGSVNIEIKDGHLFVDGVDKGEVSGSKVTVVDGVLNIDGKPAGLEVGNKVAIVKGNGVYLLTVDGETVELPMAGISLSYINVINADQTGVAFDALYDINEKDVEYGPEGGKKTLKAGLYTTLDRDLKIVVNPQSADASLFNFSLKNSAGVNTELTFKAAKAYKGTLSVDDVTSRATSSNGVWVLENDYTRYDNNNLTDIRTELYKKFKANDGKAHALTLEAANDAVTFTTPYDLSAELRKMELTSVTPEDMSYILVNEWTTPIIECEGDESAVYDYWLTVETSAGNLQKAKMYGVEISEDGHTFRFTKEAGIGNEIDFVYNYILVNGTVVQGDKAPIFTANFSQEMAAETVKVFDDLVKPFDAEAINDDTNKLLNPTSDAENAVSIGADAFGMTQTYSYAEFYNGLSEANKLVWNNAIENKAITFELFGGEGTVEVGNNNSLNNNVELLKNIRYEIDADKKEIKLQFLVDESREGEVIDGLHYTSNNFALNTAYELVMTVNDAIANNTVATLKFPFELQQPTMDIVPTDGNFSQWTVDSETKEEILLSYGAYKQNEANVNMYLPLFESFAAWTKEYTVYDSNAKYYTLSSNDLTTTGGGVMLINVRENNKEQDLASGLTYTSVWENYNTHIVNAAPNADGSEKSIMVKSNYKHYGVYSEDLFTGANTTAKENQFKLVFASLLKHSSLKMTEGSETLIASTGDNVVFISNKDLNFTTPMNGKFFLFDSLKEDGQVADRATLNELSYNEAQRPFATTGMITITAKDKNGKTEHTVDTGEFSGSFWSIDKTTGDRSFNLGAPQANITIYNVPACPVVKDTNHEWTAADVVKGHEGGIAIQLPNSIDDQQEIEFTLTVKDLLGFTNNVKFVVKKVK